MNATTKTNKSAADLREELAFYAGAAARDYKNAKEKLLARVQTNPADAVVWNAEEMVAAQTVHEAWMRISAELEGHDPREVLRENINEVAHRVRMFFGSNSTSMFSNAVERARANASVRLVEDLERIGKSYGI